jgi:hypothetical protein
MSAKGRSGTSWSQAMKPPKKSRKLFPGVNDFIGKKRR